MYKSHLFICTNGPGVPGKCGDKNSEQLFFKVKELSRGKDWGTSVRISKSGCLGQCENGTACVLYPKGEWFFKQTPESAPALTEAIEKSLNI